RKDRVAIVSMVVLVFIAFIAIFGPLISNLIGVNPYDFNTELLSDAGSLPLGAFGGVSLDHPLGVEPLTGRDILARLLYGTRISLLIAVSATIITVILGTVVGIISGYSRGRTDTILSRFMDITLAFPLLLVIIAMSPVIEQRLQAFGLPSGNPSRITTLILVLSVFGWPYLARLIRGQVISLREREFVEAAISIGSSNRRILFRELLPNLWAPILIYATIAMPGLIGAEAVLAYLGISVVPPTPTWGSMLEESIGYFTVDPFYFFVPLTMLLAVVLSFNLLGDALRDALDPKSGRH
ncbi:MAG: ABC transporter permease, partial [Candidatus Nanopelagicales bacterium]|nr:ABC transporter permease [Candidatus Nanopelagicales bacterium]